MKTKRLRAYTLLQACIATVLVAVAIVVVPPLLRPKARTCCRPNCVSNQKQLGIAFRGFGIDMGAFPMALSDSNAPSESATAPSGGATEVTN